MKRLRHGLTMSFFLAALVVIGAANAILSPRVSVSVQERRSLAAFPSLSWEEIRDGKFAEGFDSWFSDHFVLRDRLLGLSDGIRELRGFAPAEGMQLVSVGRGNRYEAAGQADMTADLPDPVEAPASYPASYMDEYLRVHLAIKPNPIQPPAPDEREQIVNDYLVVGDRAMEILSFRESAADYYASAIAHFADRIPADIPVYVAIVPTQIAVVDRVRYARIGADQAAALTYAYSVLPERVTTIAALDALYEHRDEYIYFRTDHHWTALGAYYVYCELARTIGLEPVALDTLKRGEVPGFLGSMYDLTHSARLQRNPDTVYYWPPAVPYSYVVYPEPNDTGQPAQETSMVGQAREIIDLRWAKRGNKYQVFASGDVPLSVVQVPDGPDHRLLVVKDSYGNAIVPWLVPHAREIYVVDPRMFQSNILTFITEHRIDAVLFVNTFGIMAYYGGYASDIRRIVDLIPAPPSAEARTAPTDGTPLPDATQTVAAGESSHPEPGL